MSDSVDKPDWETCLKEYERYAYWVADKLYRQRDLARKQEVRQAALIGLYDAWTRWDPSISKLTTYSFWYIKKHVTEQVATYMQDYGQDDVSTYADELAADDSLARTQALVADLLTDPSIRPQERRVAELVLLGDQTNETAAKELGLTKQRVQQIHTAVVRKLRALARDNN